MENTQETQEKAPAKTAEHLIQQVRRRTRRKFAAEDKIRIVMEGMKREISVSELCRREGIPSAIYYSWTKDFMEGGKSRLKGDSLRSATESDVEVLRRENEKMKSIIGEQTLELNLLKKSLIG